MKTTFVLCTPEFNSMFYIGSAYQLHGNPCYAREYQSVTNAKKALAIVKKNQRLEADRAWRKQLQVFKKVWKSSCGSFDYVAEGGAK